MTLEKEISSILQEDGTSYKLKDSSARNRLDTVETKVSTIESNYLPKSALDNINLENYAKIADVNENFAKKSDLSTTNTNLDNLVISVSSNKTHIDELTSKVNALEGLEGESFVTETKLRDELTNYTTTSTVNTLSQRIVGLEASSRTNIAAAKSEAILTSNEYTDNKLADIKIPDVTEVTPNYSKVSSVSLDEMMTTGYYRVVDAINTPSSNMETGYLEVSKFKDGTIKQEWHTDEYDALRICEETENSVRVSVEVNSEDTTLTGNDADSLYSVADGVLKLQANHKYTLSGFFNGHVEVVSTEAPKSKTTIVLSGFNLVTDYESGIVYKPTFNKDAGETAKSLQVILKENTYNFIACRQSSDASSVLSDGAGIYSINNLTINGVGYLSIYSNTGAHAIKANELVISGKPHIWMHALHDGIHGKDYIEIQEGYFYFDYVKDAVGTGNDGYLDVYGGTFNVKYAKENVFDSKSTVYASSIQGLSTKIIVGTALDGLVNDTAKVRILETVEVEGISVVYTSKLQWFGEPKIYVTTEPLEGSNYILLPGLAKEPDANNANVYTLDPHTIADSANNAVYYITGYFNNKQIKIYSASVDSDTIKNNYSSTAIVLDNAFIENTSSSSADCPIYYAYDKKGITVEAYQQPSYIVSTAADAIHSTGNLTVKGDSVIYSQSTEGFGLFSSDLIFRGDGLRYVVNSKYGIQGTNIHLGEDPDRVTNAKAKNSDQNIYILYNSEVDINARTSSAGKKSYIVTYQYQKGDIITNKIQSLNINNEENFSNNMAGNLYYKDRVYGNTSGYPDSLLTCTQAHLYMEDKDYESDFPNTKAGIWMINYSKYSDVADGLSAAKAKIAELETRTPKKAEFELGEGLTSIDIYSTEKAAEGVAYSEAVYARDADYAFPSVDGTGQVCFKIKSDLDNPIVNVGETTDTTKYKNFKTPYINCIDGIYKFTKITGDVKIALNATEEVNGTPVTITYPDPVTSEDTLTTSSIELTNYRTKDAREADFAGIQVTPVEKVATLQTYSKDTGYAIEADGDAAQVSLKVKATTPDDYYLFMETTDSSAYTNVELNDAKSALPMGIKDGDTITFTKVSKACDFSFVYKQPRVFNVNYTTGTYHFSSDAAEIPATALEFAPFVFKYYYNTDESKAGEITAADCLTRIASININGIDLNLDESYITNIGSKKITVTIPLEKITGDIIINLN